jgi:hypothetical protein
MMRRRLKNAKEVSCMKRTEYNKLALRAGDLLLKIADAYAFLNASEDSQWGEVKRVGSELKAEAERRLIYAQGDRRKRNDPMLFDSRE